MAEGAVASNFKTPIFLKMTPYTQYRCHGTFSCIFWLLAPFFILLSLFIIISNKYGPCVILNYPKYYHKTPYFIKVTHQHHIQSHLQYPYYNMFFTWAFCAPGIGRRDTIT